jgi:hypothetical protein
MAEGEGRTLVEAFEAYAEKKSNERMAELNIDELSFRDGLEHFETWNPVEIEVKTRPANQWVKGYKVKDRS